MNERRLASLVLALLAAASALPAADTSPVTFRKIVLSDKFYAEGAYHGDFNGDGHVDVAAGPFWYAGPAFQERFEYRLAKEYAPKGYSDNFLTFVWDFDGDRRPDIFAIDTPGTNGFWYQNPGARDGHWTRHLAFPVIDNESPGFDDLTGDGRPELIFNYDGYLGYAQPDPSRPTQPWKFHPISPKGKYHKYYHGAGVGDLNGDGRKDFLEHTGWWEQPASLDGDPVWKRHDFSFGAGAAQMLVDDVNDDGLNDVITCLDPHRYGLAWFEQVRSEGRISFRQHLLMGEKESDSPYGVKFTQIHAFALVDIDGDGRRDFVTGKRWWAHPPPTDPESDAPAVLYWFQRVGRGSAAGFVPRLIDADSGVGTQVAAADLNGDRRPDVIVSNKKGTFVFIQEAPAKARPGRASR